MTQVCQSKASLWHHNLTVGACVAVLIGASLSSYVGSDRAFWKSHGYRIGGGELEAMGIVQQKARKDSDSKPCIEDTVSEENAR